MRRETIQCANGRQGAQFLLGEARACMKIVQRGERSATAFLEHRQRVVLAQAPDLPQPEANRIVRFDERIPIRARGTNRPHLDAVPLGILHQRGR